MSVPVYRLATRAFPSHPLSRTSRHVSAALKTTSKLLIYIAGVGVSTDHAVLDVGVGALFEGSGVRAKASTATLYEELANPCSLRLIQAFSEIDNQRILRSLVEFVETMAKAK